jgi:hypothetical protein
MEVSLLIVSGRGGPIAVHTPDICFEGAGYHMAGPRAKYHVYPQSSEAVDFWVAKFRKGEPVLPEQLRIFWAWNANGQWHAPEEARLVLARYPVLYKVYVVRRAPKMEETPEQDPAADFLKVMVPTVEKALAPAS